MKVRCGLRLREEMLKRRVARGSRQGLERALERLAEASRSQVALETGRLRSSCAVRIGAGGLYGVVSYGAPYAAVQHENTEYRHAGGKKGKYLEDPAHDPAVLLDMRQALEKAYGEVLK